MIRREGTRCRLLDIFDTLLGQTEISNAYLVLLREEHILSLQVTVQNALLVQSEHAEADLDEDLEDVRLLDRPICASLASEQALKVAVLAELHHYVDFGARDERIIVFYCVRVINQLPMDINFIEGLQRLPSRHQIRLKLLHHQMLNRLTQFPYRGRILVVAFGGRYRVSLKCFLVVVIVVGCCCCRCCNQ